MTENPFEARQRQQREESARLNRLARRIGWTVGIIGSVVIVLFLAAAVLGLTLLIKVLVGAM